MPSLHVAMAVLCALIGWHRSRIAGMLLTGYAVVIQFGSVILAWHYAVDGYIGAGVAIVSWVGAKVLLKRSDRLLPAGATRKRPKGSSKRDLTVSGPPNH